jgi:hypothetical protein
MNPITIYWSKAKNLVVIPTSAKTEAGYSIDIEPVTVVPLGDLAAIKSAIRLAAFRTIGVIPTPLRGEFPKPVVLKPGKVRSWSQFHWNYFVAHINQKKDGTIQFDVWEKWADGSYRPNSDSHARSFDTLDEAMEVVIEEMEKSE